MGRSPAEAVAGSSRGLGGAVPGRKHVALWLVATPWWHKGSNLNVRLIVFFFFLKNVFYWDPLSDCTSLSPYLICSHTRLGLYILISLLCLGSGGGTRVPVGHWI